MELGTVAYKRRTERLRWDDLGLGRFTVDRLEGSIRSFGADHQGPAFSLAA
jgi:hypothetical protein